MLLSVITGSLQVEQGARREVSVREEEMIKGYRSDVLWRPIQPLLPLKVEEGVRSHVLWASPSCGKRWGKGFSAMVSRKRPSPADNDFVPATPSLDFCPPGLWHDKFMLAKVTKCVIICYRINRKVIQLSPSVNIQYTKGVLEWDNSKLFPFREGKMGDRQQYWLTAMI